NAPRFVNPGDRFAGGVIPGITGRSHYHAGRRLVTPERPEWPARPFVRQPSMRHSQSYLGEVAVESPQNRLGFGVAESHIVFERLGAVSGDHQAAIQHAAKRETFSSRGFQSR